MTIRTRSSFNFRYYFTLFFRVSAYYGDKQFLKISDIMMEYEISLSGASV